MSKSNTFAGLTGKKIGDGQPGPVETETMTEAEAVAANNNPEGESVQQATDAEVILNPTEPQPAPLNLSFNTDTNAVGIESAVGDAIDADTTVVTGERAQPQLNAEIAAESAIADDAVIYTSHPVINMNLGKYQFRNGQLRLALEEVSEFEALVEQQPPQIQHSIKKIDVDAANAKVSELIRNRQTAGIDTTGNMLDAPNARPFG